MDQEGGRVKWVERRERDEFVRNVFLRETLLFENYNMPEFDSYRFFRNFQIEFVHLLSTF